MSLAEEMYECIKAERDAYKQMVDQHQKDIYAALALVKTGKLPDTDDWQSTWLLELETELKKRLP